MPRYTRIGILYKGQEAAVGEERYRNIKSIVSMTSWGEQGTGRESKQSRWYLPWTPWLHGSKELALGSWVSLLSVCGGFGSEG